MYPDNPEKNLEIFYFQENRLVPCNSESQIFFFAFFTGRSPKSIFSQPLAENPTFRTPAIFSFFVLLLGFCVMTV